MESRSTPELIAIGAGVVVERDVLGVAAEIQRRYPNLRVQYLEGMSMGVTEAPYQIVESGKDGNDYVFMQVWELNDSVLDRIEQHNTHSVDLDAVVNKANENARKAQEKLYKESLAEAHEKAAAVIKTPKDTYTMRDGDKTIKFRSHGKHDVRRD